MADRTGIEWTDATWNPIRGCSRVSEGCRHCYAELVAARFSGPGQAYEGLARRRANGEPQWTGEIAVIEEHMMDPLRWRRPRRIFVNSMSDLFHEKVEEDTLDRIFAVMAAARRHTFQILTKRPERMRAYLSLPGRVGAVAAETGVDLIPFIRPDDLADRWPLPNVWCGTSVENQAAADARLPALIWTKAAVRFLSCEPLLGPLDLEPWIAPLTPLDKFWVIVGGESGPGARPMDVQWVRDICALCWEYDVPVFVKQLGAQPGFRLEDEARHGNTAPGFHHFDAGAQLYIKKLDNKKGGDPSEWPAELRVREFPAVPA